MFCDVEISFLELNIIQKSENKYTVFFELSVSILSFAKKKKVCLHWENPWSELFEQEGGQL